MHRPNRLTAVLLAVGASAALVLSGCSSNDDTTPAATSDSAATTQLNAAADSTAALTGAHVNLKVDGSFQGLNATAVDADVNVKPAMAGKGTATLNMGGKTVEAPFVYVGDRFYANVNGDGWLDYGDGRSIYNVSAVLDPQTGVPHILRSLDGAKIDGKETINGVETTKITGTVPAKATAGLTGAAGKDAKEATDALKTTVYITDDNQVARVVVTPADKVTMTVDISNWNKTVEVAKPADVKTPSNEKPKEAPKSGEPTREKAGS
ncbi:MAG: LppX_LprAFG lipoprotein [Gordonia sp. (in: high G+C Gram-positive bacteria)]